MDPNKNQKDDTDFSIIQKHCKCKRDAIPSISVKALCMYYFDMKTGNPWGNYPVCEPANCPKLHPKPYKNPKCADKNAQVSVSGEFAAAIAVSKGGVVMDPSKVLGEKFEIDPCRYETVEIYRNVTVVVSKCMKCGNIDIAWIRQDNTEELDPKEVDIADLMHLTDE